MSNIFTDIGHDVKVGAEDVGKGVKEAVEFAIIHPIEFLAHAEQVIATTLKDEPAAKTAIENLVAAATLAIGDVAQDTKEDFLNLPDDVKTVTDAKSFFEYFKGTFIPEVEAIYKDLKADVAPAQ